MKYKMLLDLVVSKYWKTNGHHTKIQHLFFVYCNGLHIASQTELSTGLSLQPVTHPQQLLEVSDGLNNTAQCLRREDGLNITEPQDAKVIRHQPCCSPDQQNASGR